MRHTRSQKSYDFSERQQLARRISFLHNKHQEEKVAASAAIIAEEQKEIAVEEEDVDVVEEEEKELPLAAAEQAGNIQGLREALQRREKIGALPPATRRDVKAVEEAKNIPIRKYQSHIQ